jgi:short-subunit dehydrogenase
LVVVTGASSGIGEIFAQRLAADGHDLALVARRRERLEALAKELAATHGIEAHVFERDLGQEEERVALLADLDATGRDVVGLVNNAGFGSSGRFGELDQAREREQVRVNVEAVHHLTGELLPGMVERGTGAILNVASVASFQPIPGMATYSATKAFVRSFSEAVNTELAGTGVSCTALCPGPMATEWEQVSDVGSGWMPEIAYVTPEHAVRAGIKGMKSGQRLVVPGRVPQVMALGGHLTPRGLMLPIAKRLGDLRRSRRN